jgi:formylglycine-generating enzyme required for sulfatase activity
MHVFHLARGGLLVCLTLVMFAVTAWSQTPGTTIRDCPDCPEMVVLRSGSFMMGSPESETGRDKDEGPQHTVTIARPFAAGKYEVTRGQFAAFARETGYVSKGINCLYWDGVEGKAKNDDPNRDWRDPGFSQTDNHPVVCVSWDDAKAYAAWLSRKTGKNYRLLSEAEWEYAARAGTAWARPWGEDPNLGCGFANIRDRTFVRDVPAGKGKKWTENYQQCDDRYAYTAPVGNYRPNNFGLYDMIGNAWEWVEDWWNDSYIGAPADGKPWLTGDSARRVERGGCWDRGLRNARSAVRHRGATGYRNGGLGFRLARTL